MACRIQRDQCDSDLLRGVGGGGGGGWAPERHLVLNHLEIFVVSVGIFWSGIDGNIDIYVVEIFLVIYGVSRILLDWLTLLADENEPNVPPSLKSCRHWWKGIVMTCIKLFQTEATQFEHDEPASIYRIRKSHF